MASLEVNLPKSEHGLYYDSPAVTWDEALPLGNGIMGALVWGDGHPIKISLDRTDLWDLRPVEEFQSPAYSAAQMRQWRDEGEAEKISRLYDYPYTQRAAPTKIPAGRIEISLDDTSKFARASLDLEDAVAHLHFGDAISLAVIIHATQPVGMMVINAE